MSSVHAAVLVRIAGDQQVLDQTLLFRLLSYDPASGLLVWRERPPELFANSARGREHNCSIWNSQNAGKAALQSLDPYGYHYGPIFSTKVKAHRAIFCLAHGYWPEIVDHIDGCRTNNRLENLRAVTVAENNKNLALRRSNRFGHHGVYWDAERGQWRVHAMSRFVGRYDTFDEAVSARVAEEVANKFHPNHGRRVA